MTYLIGILVGALGILQLVAGVIFYKIFSVALRMFDSAMKHQVADMGREEAARMIAKIPNAMVRKLIEKYVVAAGGTLAVSYVRGGLKSRERLSLWAVIAGAVALLLSFFTGAWLPLIWKGAA
jgi:hypothetical protein